MQATRLPGKPMLEIEGKPMIWHVWQQAVRAELGPVCVATDSAEIAAYITDSGGRAILTDPALPSGSDRIYQALQYSQEFADTEMYTPYDHSASICNNHLVAQRLHSVVRMPHK